MDTKKLSLGPKGYKKHHRLISGTKSSSSQKKKKRSSAELDATAAPSSSPRGARDTEQLVRKERTGTMAAPKTKPVKKLKQKAPRMKGSHDFIKHI